MTITSSMDCNPWDLFRTVRKPLCRPSQMRSELSGAALPCRREWRSYTACAIICLERDEGPDFGRFAGP